MVFFSGKHFHGISSFCGSFVDTDDKEERAAPSSGGKHSTGMTPLMFFSKKLHQNSSVEIYMQFHRKSNFGCFSHFACVIKLRTKLLMKLNLFR